MTKEIIDGVGGDAAALQHKGKLRPSQARALTSLLVASADSRTATYHREPPRGIVR